MIGSGIPSSQSRIAGMLIPFKKTLEKRIGSQTRAGRVVALSRCLPPIVAV